MKNSIIILFVIIVLYPLKSYSSNSDQSLMSIVDQPVDIIYQSATNIDDDIKDIAMYPQLHPDEALESVAAVAVLVALDKPVTRFYQDKIEPIFDGYSLKPIKLMSNLGFNATDGYVVLGISSSYILGVFLQDEKSQIAAILSAKAMAYSVLLSHMILKPLFGRSRPVSNLSQSQKDSPPYTVNPYAFGHFQQPHIGPYQYGTSMPSYHFTQTFAVARVYAKVYDNYLLPYVGAAAILTSNIRGHKHWVSDMVAGALIGTMIGNVVAENAEVGNEDQQSAWVIPVVSQDQVSLNLYYQF